MNECGLGLTDSPLIGKLSQEGWGTGDRGAILYNPHNWSFDMSDLTECVHAVPVEADPFALLFISNVPGYPTNYRCNNSDHGKKTGKYKNAYY